MSPYVCQYFLLNFDSAGRISGSVGKNGLNVLYSPGCIDPSCEDPHGFEDAVITAKLADVVIFVYGLGPNIESEGRDRKVLELPGLQNNLLDQIRKNVSVPIVGVLIHGGSIALGDSVKNVDALIDAWYPGMQGGTAIADVLFGNYNPGGRTPQTWYMSTDQLPDMSSMDMYEKNGRTYRFFKGNVQFPFGYGLSYTTFGYTNLNVFPTLISACDPITVSVNVTNTGKVAGDEVIQVYVKTPNATVPAPNVRLAAFERISLQPYEWKMVSFTILPRDHTVIHTG